MKTPIFSILISETIRFKEWKITIDYTTFSRSYNYNSISMFIKNAFFASAKSPAIKGMINQYLVNA